MTPLEMIATWRQGCSCSQEIGLDGSVTPLSPAVCQECTEALINALESRLTRLEPALQTAREALRRVAEPVGPLHSYWDAIVELEESVTLTEQREGARFREEHIVVKTTWNFTGQVEQLVLAPTGVMQRRVLDTMEHQARDALTSLGWVPPPKKS